MDWVTSFFIGYQISAQCLAVFLCFKIIRVRITPSMPWVFIGLAMLMMALRRLQSLLSDTSSAHLNATAFDTLIVQTVISTFLVIGFFTLYSLLKKKI